MAVVIAFLFLPLGRKPGEVKLEGLILLQWSLHYITEFIAV